MAESLPIVLSVAIGFVLGVFGGGGSMLTIPMLVLVAGVRPASAVGMSLAIVGATSLSASLAHHRRGQVRWRVAALFGGAGMVTALLAARLSYLVSGRTLMLAFAALVLAAGGYMLSGRKSVSESASAAPRPPRMGYAMLAGGAVGAITGFLGVSGGFLIVPALVGLAGLRMREAVGTSLLVIAIDCGAGFVGHFHGGALDLRLTVALTVAAVVGALLGERVARSLSMHRLRRSFGLLVVGVGVLVALMTVLGSGPLG